MNLILIIKALIMGVVEGLTEFLPISSTGHLIITQNLLNFQTKGDVFDIVIQLGAILAIVYEYRSRFAHVLTHLGKEEATNRFVANLAVAFVPAAVMGLLFNKAIKAHLFNPISVAVAFVVGALFIFFIEWRAKTHPPKVKSVDDMRLRDALVVGIAQCFALIPGTSRSGSTIMGGMWWGLDRKAATEFSFFLAVPMMVAASGYDMLKHYKEFNADDFMLIAVGFVMAFASALVAVRALLKFISSHTFIPFAWYRIAFGLLILATWYAGWVKWEHL